MVLAALRRVPAVLLCLAVSACASSEKVALREPDDSSRMRVASVAEANGQPGVALSLYGIEAGNRPDDPQAQARYAAALRRAGGVAQADEVLNQALARMPDAPELLVQAGRIRLLAGNADALSLFERVLAANPGDAEALSGKGMALDLAGRHAEALRWHAAAAAAAPADLPIANNRALSLLLAGRPDEAIAILAPLAQRPDAPVRVTNNLALAYAAAGHAATARAALHDPSGEERLERYAQLLQQQELGTSSAQASQLPPSTP